MRVWPEKLRLSVRLIPIGASSKMTIATPRLAPELIPRTNGSASGLRKMVCIINPAVASAAPARAAVRIRGNRNSRMIWRSTSSSSGEAVSACKMTAGESGVDPRQALSNAMLKTASTSSTKRELHFGVVVDCCGCALIGLLQLLIVDEAVVLG